MTSRDNSSPQASCLQLGNDPTGSPADEVVRPTPAPGGIEVVGGLHQFVEPGLCREIDADTRLQLAPLDHVIATEGSTEETEPAVCVPQYGAAGMVLSKYREDAAKLRGRTLK